jgi:hypothetical protein
MIYAVFKVGVYDQGLIDVVPSLEEAKAAAEKASDAEHDLYHDFQIRTRSETDGWFTETCWIFGVEYQRGRPTRASREWREIS